MQGEFAATGNSHEQNAALVGRQVKTGTIDVRAVVAATVQVERSGAGTILCSTARDSSSRQRSHESARHSER